MHRKLVRTISSILKILKVRLGRIVRLRLADNKMFSSVARNQVSRKVTLNLMILMNLLVMILSLVVFHNIWNSLGQEKYIEILLDKF